MLLLVFQNNKTLSSKEQRICHGACVSFEREREREREREKQQLHLINNNMVYCLKKSVHLLIFLMVSYDGNNRSP